MNPVHDVRIDCDVVIISSCKCGQMIMKGSVAKSTEASPSTPKMLKPSPTMNTYHAISRYEKRVVVDVRVAGDRFGYPDRRA
jgi:hypothetical protein